MLSGVCFWVVLGGLFVVCCVVFVVRCAMFVVQRALCNECCLSHVGC